MWQKEIGFHLDKEHIKGFNGHIVEENLFLILSVDEGVDDEEGARILQSMTEELQEAPVANLMQFELKLAELITKNNLPTNYSLAAGYLKNDILYLKTGGAGSILIYRNKKVATIVSGEKTASGYIKNNDLFIFTTDRFVQVSGGEGNINKNLDDKKPQEITGLLVRFNSPGLTKPKKRTLTFITVVVIFVIFMWSVVFGVVRRREEAIGLKVEAARVLINQKLAQADKDAFLNLPKAKTTITESREAVAILKKEIGDRKEIAELSRLITDAENQILKKEEKQAEEFYDLTVDSQQATGDLLYLDDDTVAIVDKNQKSVYYLSIAKKSLDKKTDNELKNAKLIASYQNGPVFYTEGSGIYKITDEGKTVKVVEKDKEWGRIDSLFIYNGNLYLLDPEKDSIYKYAAAENAYSAKTSYFQGSGNGLAGAISLAIDGSVYVGFSDHIFKFTSGNQDDFPANFPDENVNILKIYTNRDLEKVYAWDKRRGSIYILNKNGGYEREVASSVLTKANDFVVFEKAAYVLAGPKIYKVDID